MACLQHDACRSSGEPTCSGRVASRWSACSEGCTECSSSPAPVTMTSWEAVQKKPSSCTSALLRLGRAG